MIFSVLYYVFLFFLLIGFLVGSTDPMPLSNERNAREQYLRGQEGGGSLQHSIKSPSRRFLAVFKDFAPSASC
jgi:hypothetical protein